MTKYILAGGADRKTPVYGQNLAQEVYKTAKRSIKILSCFFASPREDWESKFEDRKLWFRQSFGEDIICKLAFPDKFEEAVAKVDLIYLHGGDDTLLAHYLDKYADLKKTFKNKMVVGSSAGANYLSKNFWTCDWRTVKKGSGLTLLNIVPHFESPEYGKDDPRGPIDWQKAETELRNQIGSSQTITKLHEGEFVVYENHGD